MLIEIASIGSEVLEGQTVNTNASFLSRELTDLGYEVSRHTVWPDDKEILSQGLKEALGRSTLVIATGGLGPTLDDLTKEISARLFRAPLHLDSKLYDELRARFGDRPSLENQATVPQDAIVLHNSLGTAPGFLFLSESGSLLLLPGPPREMEQMFMKEALPLLAAHFPLPVKTQSARLYLCQLREMQLDPLLREIQQENPDAKVGIFASLGSLLVRFSVSNGFERLAQWTARVREAFPTHLFDGPSLHEAVHAKMIAQQKKLALAESCTGGALAARITSLPDASKYFLGSFVVYANEWKEQFLGVKTTTIEEKGAVSAAVVEEMLRGVFHKTDADYAIAISGIAGPSGGTAEKPVGTIYLGVAERNGAFDIGQIKAPQTRSSAIEYAVQYALGALWRRLAFQTTTFANIKQ